MLEQNRLFSETDPESELSESVFVFMATRMQQKVFIFDEKGDVCFVNRVAEQYSGYKLSEFERKFSFEIGKRSSAGNEMRNNLEKDLSSDSGEIEFFNKNGSLLKIEVDVSRFEYSGAVYFMAVEKTETDNKLISEDSLLDGDYNNVWRKIFDSITDAIVLLDITGKVKQFNKAFGMIKGLSAEEIKEQQCCKLVSDYFSTIENCPFHEVVQSGTGRKNRIQLNDVVFQVAIEPVYDSQNICIGTIAVFENITEKEQAELELEKSDLAFRKAQQTAHVGSWTWYIQDDQLEWSNEMYCIFGVSQDTFSGKLSEVMMSSIHPDDLPEVEASNKSVIEKGEHYPVEYRIITTDGSLRYVYAEAGELVNDENGNPFQLSGIVQDITSRKVAEIELQKREHLLDRIFDILPVGLWIADEKGVLIRSNAKGREIWGEAPMVGPEKYHAFRARRLPSGIEVADDDWALLHTINKGVTVTDELLEIDALDGQKRVILNYTAPVLNENGVIEAAIVVNQDITQLQLISEQLRQSEEKFRLIAEKASDVVWLMDLKGRSLFVTPSIEFFTGYTQTEYLAQTISDRFTPDSAKIAIETLQQEIMAYSYLKKVPHDFSKTLILEYKCKDGTVKSGELLITPYFDEDENLKGLHGVTRDVTERVKINEELRKLNAELELRVKKRTSELEESNAKLSRMNKLFVGRELRMAELKEQIAGLEKKLEGLV